MDRKVYEIVRELKSIKTTNGCYLLKLYDRDYHNKEVINKSVVSLELLEYLPNTDKRLTRFEFKTYFKDYSQGYNFFWKTYNKMKRKEG